MAKVKNCYLCNSVANFQRNGKVRDNYNLKILECNDCGLVFLSDNVINKHHYQESKMHDSALDIDKWLKNTRNDDERRYQFLQEKITNKTVLDFGCGVGGFLEKAQKITKKIAGIELEKALQSSFKSRKLNVFSCLSEAQKNNQQYDIITAFHVIEYLIDPANTLTQLSKLLAYGGVIVVEVPHANDILLKTYKSKSFSEFTYWSNHLFLFTEYNLHQLAKKAKLKVNYTKQIQRYPLSNHLYWLANNQAGGHQEWSFLDSKSLHHEYEKQLASIGQCDTLIASFSK